MTPAASDEAARPTATLTVTPTSGVAPLTVEADASGSTPAPGSSIATYTFDFGDGTIVGPQTAPVASHTYHLAGGFDASVVVTDSDGGWWIAVAPVNPLGPEVGFGTIWVPGTAPITVTVDASTTTGPVPISTYTFNFGDGTIIGPQSEPTAQHSYASAATYTITVTVVDQRGNLNQGSVTVDLRPSETTQPGLPAWFFTPWRTPNRHQPQ
ncbi:MAG: PKD domain-containing protein [Candidatus Dormibacteria bacterium]